MESDIAARDFSYSQPLGTPLGDILRKALPELCSAESPLKDFNLATHAPGFEKRDREALATARTKLSALSQGDVDWLLTTTIQEGLTTTGPALLRFSVVRDMLLPRASVNALSEAANVVILQLNSDEYQTSFAIRSLREVLKKFPAHSEAQVDPISVKPAMRLVGDIIEKAGHADLDPKAVPALSRALHLALHHLKIGVGPDSPLLAGIAAHAHKELTVEERYNVKIPDPYSYDRGLGRDFDFDMFDFGSERRKAPVERPKTVRQTEQTTLLAKVLDDLQALQMSEGHRFWHYKAEGTNDAQAAWKRWASQRQARASIYMLVIGEAGGAALLPDREKYAATLRACIDLPNKVLSGCGMSALGTLVQSFSPAVQLSWFSQVKEAKSKGRRETREFEAKGAWEVLRSDLDLGLRKAPLETFTTDSLVPYLTDKHPKVRKAAFIRLDQMLEKESESDRMVTLRFLGLTAAHPFGYDSRPAYPFRAAGRMADLLEKYADACTLPANREILYFAWAGITLSANGMRARARVNLPPLAESVEKVVSIAATWNEKRVQDTIALLTDRLGGRFTTFVEKINPAEREAVGSGVIRLLPHIPQARREAIVEQMLRLNVPVEDLLKTVPEAERQKTEAAARPALERLGKYRVAITLSEYTEQAEYARIRNRATTRSWNRGPEDSAEGLNPPPDPQLEALVAQCTVEDTLFLIERATAQSSQDEMTELDRGLGSDADRERQKAVKAIGNILELSKNFDPASFAPMLVNLAKIAVTPDGQRGAYSNLSARRERAVELTVSLARRLCIPTPNDAAISTMKELLQSKVEGVAKEALQDCGKFTLVLPEARWREMGEVVRTFSTMHLHRLHYARVLALEAKDPEVRKFHLDMLLDGLRGAESIREDYPRNIEALVEQLPVSEANAFLDRVKAEIAQRPKQRGERRDWTENQILELQPRVE